MPPKLGIVRPELHLVECLEGVIAPSRLQHGDTELGLELLDTTSPYSGPRGGRRGKTAKPTIPLTLQACAVRKFDGAVGADQREQKAAKSVTSRLRMTLPNSRKPAKPLKQWRERRGSNPRPPA